MADSSASTSASAADRAKPRVLSGVQPSGRLHLGNYFGALRHFVPLQDSHDTFYCVVDLHAITVHQNAEELREAIYETAAAFLASGLRPDAAVLFNQSRVAAHSQLAWMFNCVARLGWLERMTQFKDKTASHRERASAGLYVYPTLMAADILCYRAGFVPVGEDQRQHLELTRDIAEKFNHDWCGGEEYFPLPEPLISQDAARIMSLRDGTKKMSKSDASDAACIYLSDDADTIASKLRKAKSDSEPLPGSETLDSQGRPRAGVRDARPEAWNLLGIWQAASGATWAETLERFAGKGFAQLKESLTEAVVAEVVPLGREINRHMADRGELERILADGAGRAEAVATPIVRGAAERMGLLL